jgi:hypothetical protein
MIAQTSFDAASYLGAKRIPGEGPTAADLCGWRVEGGAAEGSEVIAQQKAGEEPT